MGQAEVIQLGRNKVLGRDQSGKGTAQPTTYADSDSLEVSNLARYQFQDIFPVNISAIDLSFDNSDQIEEYTVEFAVQSYSRIEA